MTKAEVRTRMKWWLVAAFVLMIPVLVLAWLTPSAWLLLAMLPTAFALVQTKRYEYALYTGRYDD